MPPQLLTSFFRLVAVFLVFSFMNTPTGYTEPQAHLGRLEKISLPPDNPYTSIDIRENNEAMDALDLLRTEKDMLESDRGENLAEIKNLKNDISERQKKIVDGLTLSERKDKLKSLQEQLEKLDA